MSRGGAVEAALSSHWAQSFTVEAGGRAIETSACTGHSANNDGDCYWTTPIDAVREHEGRIVLQRQSVAVVTGVPGGADLRMRIGYDDADRLISYPDAHNLSGCA